MAKREIPPSTELTPDEYYVRLDGSECVHVFVPTELVRCCEQFLKSLNIKLRSDRIHKLDSHKNVISALEKVAKTPKKEESLLLLIFWGNSLGSGVFNLESKESIAFYEIWSKFCNESWRNLPKVFLLNVIKSKTSYDSCQLQLQGEYSTPNEGNILIVLKQNADQEESECFIEELRKLVGKFGKTEDICSIITALQVSSNIRSRPIIISTMLKKLFFIPSEYRGHHLDLYMNHDVILQEITSIKKLLEMKSSELPKGETKETPQRRRSSNQSKQIIDQLEPPTNTQRRKSSAKKRPHWV